MKRYLFFLLVTSLALGQDENWSVGEFHVDDVPRAWEEFLRDMGVEFPPGAYARYSAAHSQLIVQNTAENLATIQAVLDAFDLRPLQVAIQYLMLHVQRDIVRDWGLDGPARKPEASPLGRRVPLTLDPEDAAKVVSALRQAPGTRVAAQLSGVTVTGTTSTFAAVDRIKTRLSSPPGSFSEEEVGAVGTLTPTVAASGVRIQVDLKPTARMYIGTDAHGLPKVIERVTSTSYICRSGQTVLFCMSGAQAEASDQAFVMAVTVSVFRL